MLNTVGRITGKVWNHSTVSIIGDCVVGGTVILYSDSWSNVKTLNHMQLGTMVEVNGKWNGVESRVISVYRPSMGTGLASLRVTLDKMMNGKCEQIFWEKLGDAAKIGPVMIGGDFNMGVNKLEKKLKDCMGSWGRRCELKGNKGTFRRWDTINTKWQESEIDHVIWCGEGGSGVRMVDEGEVCTDHIPLLGWVERECKKIKVRRIRMNMEKGLRSTDKGASKRFSRAMDKVDESVVKEMSIEEVVEMTMRTVRKISKGRANNLNPNGYSPASRILSLRMSVHGTACKMQGDKDYDEKMRDRVTRLKRAEECIKLSEEEVEWLKEHRQYTEPLDWTQWKMRFKKEASNVDQMMLLRRLNNGKRRKEIRGDRTLRVQSDADAGKTGGVIRKIVGINKGFKMESIIVEGEIVTDGRLVTKHATRHFKGWFYRSPEEKARDCELARLMGCDNKDMWAPFMMDLWNNREETKEMEGHIRMSMIRKVLCKEGIEEGKDLENYVPTWDEFRNLL